MLLLYLILIFWITNSLTFSADSLLTMSQRKELTYYITFLLPINFVIFSFTQERGILSRYGFKQFLIIFIQIVAVSLLLKYPINSISSVFNNQFFSILNKSSTYIPQISIISFEFSLLVLASMIIHQPSIRQGGSFGSLIFIFISFLNIDNPDAFILFYALAGSVMVASIILNSYTLAYHDELTGLSSRRALKQYLMSLGNNYSLAMVDVDHFKKVNDNYGHDVGDQVLRQLAGYLKNVDGGAKAYRYGGEEFTIVYNNKTASEAAVYADKLRKLIEKDSFSIRNKSERPRRNKKSKRSNRKSNKTVKKENLKYTVSIGIAEHQNHHKSPFDTLKMSDKALYTAKQKGRNCVVIAKPKD